MTEKYDAIGINYTALRKPDPRIARLIHSALGTARSVVNIGAGAGSYEPQDRLVIAVEPSHEMIKKRGADLPPVVQARAESLPFGDHYFDAAMAVLTVHHWRDLAQGLCEMRRVTRGPIVIVTHDPSHRPWLSDYLPALAALDEVTMPALDLYRSYLGPCTITPLLVPHDCCDGFLYAYWRRPAAYLDPYIRSAMSSFWAIGNVDQELGHLRADLESGVWRQHYGHLLAQECYDVGLRLVVAEAFGPVAEDPIGGAGFVRASR